MPVHSSFDAAPIACALLVLLLAGSSCQEEVSTAPGTDIPFSLYGVLNPEADTQWIRVYEVNNERLTPAHPAPLRADFTSTLLETSVTRTWQDSVMQLDNGTFGHFFWAAFRPDYNKTYRLVLRGSDERTSQVRLHVPVRVATALRAPYVVDAGENAGVILPLSIDGAAARLYRPEATYLVRYGTFPEDVARLSLPYPDRPEQTNNGWLFEVNVSEDYHTILRDLMSRQLYHSACGIKLLRVTLTVRIVNEGWMLPDFVTNVNQVAQPGVFSNVENGFGFVGSGYSEQARWDPSEEIVHETPFLAPRDTFPDGCPSAGPRP